MSIFLYGIPVNFRLRSRDVSYAFFNTTNCTTMGIVYKIYASLAKKIITYTGAQKKLVLPIPLTAITLPSSIVPRFINHAYHQDILESLEDEKKQESLLNEKLTKMTSGQRLIEITDHIRNNPWLLQVCEMPILITRYSVLRVHSCIESQVTSTRGLIRKLMEVSGIRKLLRDPNVEL